MKSNILVLLSIWIITSCAPIRHMKTAEKHTPSLGDLGMHSSSIMHSSFDKIGNPVFKKPIAVSMQYVPFTKSKYKKYVALEESKGKKPSIVFADSIMDKPKYLRLEISNKIGIKEALNNTNNKNVLSYLKNDSNYSIISKIAMVTDSQKTAEILHADALYLMDTNRQILLCIQKGKNKNYLNLTTTEIFDYSVSKFCWGETKYGKLQIETLLNKGENCPKGTQKKAQKLVSKRDKAYLKS